MTRSIIYYYWDYDEDSRLIKDNAHRVEYETTIYYLDKYIDGNSKLLDISAGTGRYSLYYAMKGISVFALDIVDKHVKAIRDKLINLRDIKMSVDQGNALHLSRFQDGEFNSVLCMGPLYHLSDRNQQTGCLSECKRVLGTEGILAVAYINKDTHMELGGDPYFMD